MLRIGKSKVLALRVALAVLTVLGSAALAQPRGRTIAVGIPSDWSRRHLVMKNSAAGHVNKDPRVLANLGERAAFVPLPDKFARSAQKDGRKTNRKRLKPDWSVSLGSGRVAPTMSPAKFGFYTDAPVTAANCTTDFVVYALDVPGTPTQANIVAFNNLYSGTDPDNGLCNPFTGSTNAATVYWSYNASTATCGGGSCPSDGNKTSPSLSFDATGSKVAFVESVSDANAVCPGRPGTGPCSIFHVLRWNAGEGTVTSPAVAGQGGSAAVLVSITYASAANSTSSAWIDYSNDVAYVAADDGNLYRITGVFNGSPSLDTSFTMSVTGSAVALSSPVQLTGTFVDPNPPNSTVPFDVIAVGDGSGNLWAIDVLSRRIMGSSAAPTTPAPAVVGGNTVGGMTPGVLDAPLVYYDSVGDARHISVFATASSSANSNPTITGKAAIVQGLVELNASPSLSTFDDVADTPLGIGASSTQPINLHAPAFDNAFYSSPTTGFVYACGTSQTQPWPTLYRIGFSNPLPSPRELVPVMNAATVTSTAIASSTTGAECSPLTEFANPNLATTDILFLSISGDAQRVSNWDITGPLQSWPMGQLSEPGGTSAIIVDNTQLTSGNGTSQGSSIYFSTLATSNNCGANTYCAVKLRQGDLK